MKIKWNDQNGVLHFGKLICVHQTMMVEIPVPDKVKSIPGNVYFRQSDAAAYVRENNEVKTIPATWIKFEEKGCGLCTDDKPCNFENCPDNKGNL